jgi:hypothetical protein
MLSQSTYPWSKPRALSNRALVPHVGCNLTGRSISHARASCLTRGLRSSGWAQSCSQTGRCGGGASVAAADRATPPATLYRQDPGEPVRDPGGNLPYSISWRRFVQLRVARAGAPEGQSGTARPQDALGTTYSYNFSHLARCRATIMRASLGAHTAVLAAAAATEIQRRRAQVFSGNVR